LGHAIVPPPDPDTRADLHAAHPGLAQAESLNSFRRFPVLAQEEGRCIFLSSEERCTIYSHRPLVCRAFPLQVDEEAGHIQWSQRCRSTRTDESAKGSNTLKADALAHYQAKADDLVMLRRGKKELISLGLDAQVHNPPLNSSFAALLKKKRRG
jgi:Fe-S-cluster containining protein